MGYVENPPPSGLTCSLAAATSIKLDWVNNDTYDSIDIYRKVAGGTYSLLTSVSGSAVTYTNSSLVDGTNYYYKIWGIIGADHTVYSNEDNQITTLTAPTSMHVDTIGETTATVHWTNGSNAETECRIYKKPSGGATTYVGNCGADSVSYDITGLVKGTSYTFYVCTYNSTYGESTRASCTGTTVELPGVPTGLALSNVTETQIELNWVDGADTDNMYIYRSTNGTTWTNITNVAAGVETYTDTGLDYNQIYYYRLRGKNADGYGSYCSSVNDTTDEHIAYLVIDLGSGGKQAFSKFSIKSAASNFKDFTIHRSSNGTSWTLVYTGQMDGTTSLQHFTFTNLTENRYWKITNTSNYGHTDPMKIYEVYAYEIPYGGEYLDADVGAGTTKTPVRMIIKPKSSGVKEFILYSKLLSGDSFTTVTTGSCVAGDSENEFIFENTNAHRYFRLYITNTHADTTPVGVAEWRLHEATPIGADTNYYIFTHELNDIVRRVIFPEATSMDDFITDWLSEHYTSDDTPLTLAHTTVNTTNDTITVTSHKFHAGDRVKYNEDTGSITPLVNGTSYFIHSVVDANTIKLTATRGGAVKDLTGTTAGNFILTPNMYDEAHVTFEDIDDNTDVAQVMSTAGYLLSDGSPITDALLDAACEESVSVITLLTLHGDDDMFGVPEAYTISLTSTGPTSLHELKQRKLVQELSGGSWIDKIPYEYEQNKFIFGTAESNMLLFEMDDDGMLSTYTIIGTGLKTATQPYWANAGNRAFMVNGEESDCDSVWTDGDAVYLNGITPPDMPTDGLTKTIAQSYISIADNTITFPADHTFASCQRVVYYNGTGGDAAPLVDGTTYYVIWVSSKIIKLATSAANAIAGTAIDITSDGTTDDQSLVATPITGVASGGSIEDGSYYVKVKYHRTTYGTNDSNPGDEYTVTITGGAGLGSIVVDVPASDDPQVDEIHIYRTKLGDSFFYKSNEETNTYVVSDPTRVTQFTLTIADNAMGANDLEEDNDIAPKSEFIVYLSAINRMAYINNNGVYFSKAGFYEQVPVENLVPIAPDDGEKIMGARVVQDYLVVWKETSMHSINIHNITDLKSVCISGTVGLLDNKGVAIIADGQLAMWPSAMGFCVTDGVNVTNISKGKSITDESGNEVTGCNIFNDFVNNFDYANKHEVTAIFLPKRQQYICITPYTGLDENNNKNYRIWIYDIVKGSFYKYSVPIRPLHLFALTDQNDIHRLVASFTQIYNEEYYGYFQEIDNRSEGQDIVSIDTGTETITKQDIACDLITSWFDLGAPERNKSFRLLYTKIKSTGPVSMTVYVGINHRKTFAPGATTIAHTGEIIAPTTTYGNETVDAGEASVAGRDQVEGWDFGQTQTLVTAVDAIGEEFSVRYVFSTSYDVRIDEVGPVFRIRGVRPLP